MSNYWAVRVNYTKGNSDVRMPEKCIYCGGAPETISIISTNYRKENHMFTRRWEIPYCKKHLALQKEYRQRLKMPYLFAFSIAVVALISAPFTIQFGNSILSGFGIMLTGVSGYLGGCLIRFLIKKQRVKKNPQLEEMFKDAYLGIKIRSYVNLADFEFTNKQVATEFLLLNKRA